MLLRIIGSLGTGEVTEKHAVSWQRTLRVQVVVLNKIRVQLCKPSSCYSKFGAEGPASLIIHRQTITEV